MAKLEIVIAGKDEASGIFKGIGSAAQNMGDVVKGALAVFGGQVLFAGLKTGISALQGLASEAIDAAGEQQLLGLALESLVAKEIRSKDAALSMGDALAKAAPQAEELKGWLQQLAIVSPFSQDQIGASLRLSLAFGATITEAQKLTKGLVDYASATGQTGEVTQRIALTLGQLRQQGKVTGMEMRELALAGVPIKELLAKAFNTTTAEIDKMNQDGLIPAAKAIEAVNAYFGEFAGAAERGAKTLPGFITSIADIRRISLGILGDQVWQKIQPFAQNFVDTLNNPQIRESMRSIGDSLGVKLRGALEWLSATGTPIVRELWSAFQSGGLSGLAGKLGADLSGLWTNTIWPEISQWPARLWEWIAGPGGVLETLTPQLNAFADAMVWWSLSDDTIKRVESIGDNIAGAIIGTVTNDSQGVQTVGGFAGAMTKAVAAMAGTFAIIGVEIGKGLVEGIFTQLNSKDTKDKLTMALETALFGGTLQGKIDWIRSQIDGAVGMGLESHADGGIVGGPLGAPRLILAHGGEGITPVSQMTQNFNLTVNSRATTENVAQSFYMMKYLARGYQ